MRKQLFASSTIAFIIFFVLSSAGNSQWLPEFEPGKFLNDSVNYEDSVISKHALHKHPFPLGIYGVEAGNASERTAVNSLGQGTFDREGGHGGSRFYSIPSEKVQFCFYIGVDHVIEGVSVTSVEYPFEELNSKTPVEIELPQTIQKKITGDIWLNDNSQKVIDRFGVPNREELTGDLLILEYNDDERTWEEVFTYEAEFTFKNDRLIRITIYNGE